MTTERVHDGGELLRERRDCCEREGEEVFYPGVHLSEWEQQPGESHYHWYARTHREGEREDMTPEEREQVAREEDYRRMHVILYLAAALLVGCGLAGWVAYRLIGG